MSEDLTSAWPAQVRLGDIRRDSPARTLSANLVEREAIARGLDLLELKAFEASVRLAPWRDGVQVEATWSAAMVRACSLTLESFESVLRGAFTVRLAPDAVQDSVPREEIVVDLEADDPPDPLRGEVVPLGALLVEHLALELEPFPRAPGARFEPPAEPPEPSPFAVLARLAPRPD